MSDRERSCPSPRPADSRAGRRAGGRAGGRQAADLEVLSALRLGPEQRADPILDPLAARRRGERARGRRGRSVLPAAAPKRRGTTKSVRLARPALGANGRQQRDSMRLQAAPREPGRPSQRPTRLNSSARSRPRPSCRRRPAPASSAAPPSPRGGRTLRQAGASEGPRQTWSCQQAMGAKVTSHRQEVIDHVGERALAEQRGARWHHRVVPPGGALHQLGGSLASAASRSRHRPPGLGAARRRSTRADSRAVFAAARPGRATPSAGLRTKLVARGQRAALAAEGSVPTAALPPGAAVAA